MANKQKHKYSLGFKTRDQIKALAGSAKRRIANIEMIISLIQI